MENIIFHKESYVELRCEKTIKSSDDSNIKTIIKPIKENIYSISASANIENVRKLVIRFEIPCVEKYQNVLIHDFLNSGFKKLVDSYKSKFFCSVFDNDGVGITVMNNLPSKFDSNILVEKENDKISIFLETIIPYSYDGDFFSECFTVTVNLPYTEALLLNASNSSAHQISENPIGWGSWDYYFTAVDEDAIRENTDFITNDEILSKKIKYIAIDDGWQQREGDWQEGIRFKNGLGNTVKYINDKGYSAGIWTAPTRLHYLSGTVMRRNEFLLKDKYGDPLMDEEFYILDPTHPDGESFIRETYSYIRKKGFTFYKIDFINNMLSGEYFYDKNAGPYDALKKLISVIRECVGKESHIMGCSLPYGYGSGDVDSRRTGLDIHNTWKHIKKCSEIYFPQFASQKSIYQNDLDYLIVRGKDTTDEKDTNVLNPSKGKYLNNKTDEFRWRDGEDFSYSEAKFWCTVILMSGSSVILSDRLSLLNEKGLDLVRKTVENADFISAIPMDNHGDLPNIWYKKENGSIYILNYTEDTKTYSVNTEEKYKDIFSGKVFSSENGVLTISLEKHDSIALKKENNK